MLMNNKGFFRVLSTTPNIRL